MTYRNGSPMKNNCNPLRDAAVILACILAYVLVAQIDDLAIRSAQMERTK